VFPTSVQTVWRIPWTSRDPPLLSPQTQTPMLSGGSHGHPGILPWCPLRHRSPCCPEDPLDFPGSFLGVPSDTGPRAVRRIPWCPLRHRPPNCLEDPLGIPGSSLGVPSDTGLQTVWKISWASRDPPLVSPQTEGPILSGGALGHPGILP